MAEDWITTVEAAALSGYHVNHIRRLIRLRQIDARKFGPVWQISRHSLERYIEKGEQADDKRWGPKT
jgi:excisionase family DNA binding protein